MASYSPTHICPECGKPCNKNDLIKAGYTSAEIRYGSWQEKLVIVKFKGDK